MEIVLFVWNQVKENVIVLLVLLLLAFLLDRRWFHPVRRSLRALGNAVQSLLAGFQLVGTILTRRQLIQAEEYMDFVRIFGQAHQQEITEALGGLGNPLLPEEYTQLQHYTQKVLAGEPFTLQEAQNFHRLSRKLSEERPEAPGSWLLALLAGFLLGMLIGSQRD